MKDIAILLHETAGLLRRRFEREARPQGLTLLQWRTLGLLDKQGPLRQVAVVEALEVSPMAVSDLAERLEAAGLVERASDPADSRAKTLALTELGTAKIAAMRSVSEEVFADAFAGFSDRDSAALRQSLQRIKSNMGGT